MGGKRVHLSQAPPNLRTALDALDAVLCKGGPFIGPRGGKWSDPQHTVPWKPSGGVIRVSNKEVREAVDRVIDPGSGGSTTTMITQADGSKRRVRVNLVLEDKITDHRGVKGAHTIATHPGSGAHTHEVTLIVHRGLLAGDPDKLLPRVRGVLAHELTHAADPGVQKRAVRRGKQGLHGDSIHPSETERGGRVAYLNQPHEVTAKMQQIQREILSRDVVEGILQEHKDWAAGTPEEQKEWEPTGPEGLLEWESESWNQVQDAYTPANRRRVLKMAAKTYTMILDGTMGPIDKSLRESLRDLGGACSQLRIGGQQWVY